MPSASMVQQITANKMHGGWARRFRHQSQSCGCPMHFSVFFPPQTVDGRVPVLFFLSGLTCTDENFTVKAGAQRKAAELGIALVAPDTSPRGLGVPGEAESYDFGVGAGFYVNATQPKWRNWRMYDYVSSELPALLRSEFGDMLDVKVAGITGHSMGGHGALTLGLRHPGKYASISAFSPICNPTAVPWGRKAFTGYLGEDPAAWAPYDASLVAAGYKGPARHILVDQGLADNFLEAQLKPGALQTAVAGSSALTLSLRMHEGYDHSYYFITSFINDHLEHHAKALHAAMATKYVRMVGDQHYDLSKNNYILEKQCDKLESVYDISKTLGKGAFGEVRLAVHKVSGASYACKTISKRILKNMDDIDDIRREVHILHHLAGHSNVAQLVEVFEDKSQICLILELCSGGELFDRIVSQQGGKYSEAKAASLFRTMVQVVSHCHEMGVIHRDLKPENFLLADSSENAELKCTDFGLSVFFTPGAKFKDLVGSAYYVAPEVLNKCYSYHADLWTCGVILYILLTGVPPFWGDNTEAIFASILKSPTGAALHWPDDAIQVSDAAKDCVAQMLVRDPEQRATAKSILQHPWLVDQGVASATPVDTAVLLRMRGFAAMNKLKKAALTAVAKNLPREEIQGLRELFKAMDTDGSNSITVEELRQGLQAKGNMLPDDDLMRVMRATDVDANGVIDYEEFLAATLHLGRLENENHLMVAFDKFDADGSGYISIDELRGACGQQLSAEEVDQILEEVDKDRDGRINYAEFADMMREGNDGDETRRLACITSMY